MAALVAEGEVVEVRLTTKTGKPVGLKLSNWLSADLLSKGKYLSSNLKYSLSSNQLIYRKLILFKTNQCTSCKLFLVRINQFLHCQNKINWQSPCITQSDELTHPPPLIAMLDCQSTTSTHFYLPLSIT